MEQIDQAAPQVWVELIRTLPLIITAVVALIGAIVSLLSLLQSRKNTGKISETVEHVVELKKNTDGLTTALTSMTARANTAEGHAAGVEDERTRPPEKNTLP